MTFDTVAIHSESPFYHMYERFTAMISLTCDVQTLALINVESNMINQSVMIQGPLCINMNDSSDAVDTVVDEFFMQT